jgi:peptide chain release factor subunit 1
MSLNETLNELAAFAPTNLPVISLYLNTQADQNGRANFDSFLRKELKRCVESFPSPSSERASIEADVERIEHYLAHELRHSSRGLAIFACNGADGFFKAVQLDAPIDEHSLYVYRHPHLYPLARLNDQLPRYAALIADTNSARLYVFGVGEKLDEATIQNEKTNRTQVGGWSQARYQRHIDNLYLHHAKDVVEALDKVVSEEEISYIILAGDEVILPVLRQQLPQHLNEKVIDVLRLGMKTPEHEVAAMTLEALRRYDAKDDENRIRQLMDESRSLGLAVAGAYDTLTALANGQVDELFVTASLEEIRAEKQEIETYLVARTAAGTSAEGAGSHLVMGKSEDGTPLVVKVADELITQAQQTGAKIKFIEDPSLLAEVGGIAATLRYRM